MKIHFRTMFLQFSLLMAAALLMVMPNQAQAQSAPIQIKTCQDLQNINQNLSGNYQLANDIYCYGFGGTKGFVPIGSYTNPFTGTLSGLASDGQTVYRVENLTIKQPNNYAAPFIAISGISPKQLASIHDLELTNVNIQGGVDAVAGLALWTMGNTSISNVSINGVIGSPDGSTAQDISGAFYIVGSPTVTNDIVTNVSVDLRSRGDANTGINGFAEFNYGTITQSSAHVLISTNYQAEGFINSNYGTISDSYANGAIISNEAGYGFGNSNYGTINNSYAAVKMNTSIASGSQPSAGFVGTQNGGGKTTNSFWDTTLSGPMSSASGTGETTDNMFQNATFTEKISKSFTGFDFTNVWSQYPALRKKATLTINVTGSGYITSAPAAVSCVGSVCQGSFNSGSVITLIANPNVGNTFGTWSGVTCNEGAQTGSTCTFTLNKGTILSASFVATPLVLLNLVLSGPGQASFVSSSAGLNCSLINGVDTGTCYAFVPKNQPVTLTATTSPAGTPIAWNINGCSTTATTCTMTPSPGGQNWNIQVPPYLALTLNVSGNGYGNLAVSAQPSQASICGGFSVPIGTTTPPQPGTAFCNGSYAPGTQLTLTETPVAGSVFNGWTGFPGCTNQNSCTFTINNTTTGAANFVQLSPSGSILNAGSGQGLVTNTGIWSFSSAITQWGNVILHNGQQASGGSAVTLLYYNGQIYANNNVGGWYQWSGYSWNFLTTGDPRVKL